MLCNMLSTVLLLYVQCDLLWQEPSRTSWEAGVRWLWDREALSSDLWQKTHVGFGPLLGKTS